MKTNVIERKLTVCSSTVLPEVSCTDDPEAARVIEWADQNPKVWEIVTASSAKTCFGRESSDYFGFERGDKPEAVLARAVRFREKLLSDVTSFWQWRAQWAFDHWGEKGYTSGFFQQFDGEYPRGCMFVDYTPPTLEEVIDRFLAWCGDTYVTCEVWLAPAGKASLDKRRKIVRRLP